MKAITNIDNSRIIQPFYTAPIILEPRSGRHFRNLEFLVFFRKLHRNLIENIQNPRLVYAVRIFTNIFFII